MGSIGTSLFVGVVVGYVLSSFVSFWLLLILAAIAFVAKKKLLPSRNAMLAREDEEKARPLLDTTFGRGKPVLSGIRVLELANTVAVPICARILGELGAEVFKIEQKDGEMLRKFVKILQGPERRHSVAFDAVNINKASVVLDVKTAEGLKYVKSLLKECDVFVTNVRLDALSRAGLDFDTLNKEFPKLIYASLTAWGSTGPDAGRPGYDLGAFYVATGFAGRVQVRPEACNYSHYVSGFGDVCTATALCYGIGAALTSREKTGKGQLVSSSLLKMGYWCMSAELIKEQGPKKDSHAAPNYKDVAKQSPLKSSYMSKDGKLVQLLADSWPGIDGSDEDVVKKIMSETDMKDIPVPHIFVPSVRDLFTKDVPSAVFESAGVFMKCPEGTQSVSKMARIPVDFSCHPHDNRRMAPLLGQHTKSILREGWSPRTQPSFGTEAIKAPFDGVVVVEWSDGCNLVPEIVGSELRDFGATVYQSHEPSLKQLRRDKQTCDISFDLSKAHILLCNRKDVNVEELHSKYPHLVIGNITPFGVDGPQEPRSSFGPYTAAGGCSLFFGTGFGPSASYGDTGVSCFPEHFGDFVTAQHLAMGVSLAWFHYTRTKEGQVVNANFLRSSMFGCSCLIFPCILYDPETMLTMFDDPSDTLRDSFVVPSANSFETKDGWCLTLLGAELERHLPKTLKALGFSKTYYASVAVVFLANLRKARLARLKAVIRKLNHDMAEVFKTKTLKEWEPILAQHDIWYQKVFMLQEAKEYRQAHEIGIFARDGEIVTPVTLHGWEEGKMITK